MKLTLFSGIVLLLYAASFFMTWIGDAPGTQLLDALDITSKAFSFISDEHSKSMSNLHDLMLASGIASLLAGALAVATKNKLSAVFAMFVAGFDIYFLIKLGNSDLVDWVSYIAPEETYSLITLRGIVIAAALIASLIAMNSDFRTGASEIRKSGSIAFITTPFVIVALGLLLAAMNNAAMNSVLPMIIYDFGGLERLNLIFHYYAIAQIAVIPLAGWLADKFGAKSVIGSALGLLSIGAGIAALSNSLDLFIGARVLQAIGAGLLLPVGIATMYRMAPQGHKGAALALLGLPLLIASPAGGYVSSLIIEHVSWQRMYAYEGIAGVILLLASLFTVPSFKRQSGRILELPTILLASVALAAFVYGLYAGITDGWTSMRFVVGSLAGAASLFLLVYAELRQKEPALGIRLFGSGNYRLGVLLVAFAQIALFAATFLIPIFLQIINKYTPLRTSAYMLVLALGSALFMFVGGSLYDRIGIRRLALFGLSLGAVALVLFSQADEESTKTMLFITLFLIGAGMGLCMTPLYSYVLERTPDDRVNRAASLFTGFTILLVTISTTLIGQFMNYRIKRDVEDEGITQIIVGGLNDTALLSAVIVAVGVLLAYRLRPPQARPIASVPVEMNNPFPPQ
ncbi:MFS transporter [Cohnella yongneupensis]|uniref:MFS transporter n=1 Tax=Cohnella yongneupensis TaxID=425006 RepID=A0ABW0QZB2_9BACL